MIPTVSPGPTPNPASPAAMLRTRSPYSRQVICCVPPTVRNATCPGRSVNVS
ncbi:hypothetical protein NSK11_contig00030-0015 [Nocardia seriolae]|uniref:Uncharacterized protein n=1 Tax=Nocardia seriolae TaxID=37332 RepID=A0ABC9YSA9_9NOCA|nr:hypothetical protein NS07_v2contig00025-0049 [Nocardia seriolae]GAP28186.1 hypothetical protein NSK11_contig00030-0015 [Nocardia seriolae]